jgi:hypothetical protein
MGAALAIVLAGVSPAAAARPMFDAPFLTVNIGGVPGQVDAADVDGDGLCDIVVDGNVLYSNGDRTFRHPVPLPSGVTFPPRLPARGDLNGDGVAETVVLAGRGLEKHPCWWVGGEPHGSCGIVHFLNAAIGDVNGDGLADVVLGGGHLPSSNAIEVDYGDGALGFPSYSNKGTGDGCYMVRIADVDRDGHNDVVTANDASRTVSVLYGIDLGPHADFGVGREPQDVAVGDFDGDGNLDLVAATTGCQWITDGMTQCEAPQSASAVTSVSVLFARGGRSFGGHGITVESPGAIGTALSDLDGDGRADLVTLNRGGTVSVFRSTGNGTFAPRVDYPMGSGTGLIRVADLNGDGRPDLVVPNRPGNVITARLGTGGAAFGPALTSSVLDSPEDVVIGDINGDGRPDAAIPTGSGNIKILRGNGDGTFTGTNTISIGSIPLAIGLGDVNGDGHLDLVSATYFVEPRLSLGDGTFTFTPAATTIPGARIATVIALADLNGDGLADLMTLIGNSFVPDPRTITVNLSLGGGSFGPPVDWTAGLRPNAVAVVDLDGDGKPDLVTSDGGANATSVLLGNGDGTFQDKLGFGSTGDNPTGLSVGDVNGDGGLDLAMADTTSNGITILLRVPGSTTPTLVEMFTALPAGDGVELKWRLSNDAPATGLRLERRDDASPAWSSVAVTPRFEGDAFVATDRGAVPGHDYTYRLRGTVAGADRILGTVSVRVDPVALTATLSPVAPTPVRRVARISYTLGRSAEVRLSVCDVQGRMVDVIERGRREPGSHQATWSGRADGHNAAAGIYFVRLEVDGRKLNRTLVLAP